MRRWLLIWTLLLLWSTGERFSFAQSGVLLGLHYDAPITEPLPYYAGSADSLLRPMYQTIMIVENGGTIAMQKAADGLLIPRNNLLWRVQTKRSVYNNWVEDFVWSAPSGSRPRLAGIQPYNGEHCEGHRAQSILYAGADYLSLEQRSAGYCEGGVHPWYFNTLAVVPIDSTAHTGLSIERVLNQRARTVLIQRVTDFLDGLDEEEVLNYMPEADHANWGLIRREGRWTAVGRVENLEEVGAKHHTDLPLNVAIPNALVGGGGAITNWRRIKSFAPDAIDAFAAPEQNWLVILHPRRLTVHPLIEGTIGPATLTHRVPFGTRAVMAHWVRGTRLNAWSQQFERFTASSGS